MKAGFVIGEVFGSGDGSDSGLGSSCQPAGHPSLDQASNWRALLRRRPVLAIDALMLGQAGAVCALSVSTLGLPAYLAVVAPAASSKEDVCAGLALWARAVRDGSLGSGLGDRAQAQAILDCIIAAIWLAPHVAFKVISAGGDDTRKWVAWADRSKRLRAPVIQQILMLTNSMMQ